MVVQFMQYDIRPEKADAYFEWQQATVPRLLTVPGLVELRAHRPITGTHQVVVSWEFADLSAWAGWFNHKDVQQAFLDIRQYVRNLNIELWGPSPNVPEPVRPGG